MNISNRCQFPFLKRSSYLFPSFEMNEESWNLFQIAGTRVIMEVMTTLAAEIFKRHGKIVPVSKVFLACFISNLELNRFILKQCDGWITDLNVHQLEKAQVWITMMRLPAYGIEKRCAFCEMNTEKMSNIAEYRIGGHLVTINDLSAAHNGRPIEPTRPHLFTHPFERLECVWSTTGVGFRGHMMTYWNKVALREEVQAYHDDRSDAMLTYFHFTEGEESGNVVTGWHGHVASASKGKMKIIEWTTGDYIIRWCDYVLLCGCFKILMKLNKARTGEVTVLTKFTELPYPVAEVYRDLYDSKQLGARWSQACICIQIMMLATGGMPKDLVVTPRQKNFSGKLWTRLCRFLNTWRYWETKWHQFALMGEVPICREWREVGNIVGGEYPEWKCVE
jgi:hypothetical protein